MLVEVAVWLGFAAGVGWATYRLGYRRGVGDRSALVDKYTRITEPETRATGTPTNIKGGPARVGGVRFRTTTGRFMQGRKRERK